MGLLFFILAASWPAMQGCGKSSTATSATCNLVSALCSCDATATSTKSCSDYEGVSVDSAKSKCTSGTFSSTALCPTTSRVGTCKTAMLNDKTYIRYYADAITNQAGCSAASLGLGLTGAVEWIAN